MTDILTAQERNALKLCLEQGQLESIAPRRKPEAADAFASCVDRRAFLRGGAAALGSAALALSFAKSASARATHNWPQYGPVSPALDESTGLPLIQLPAGFKYWSFGWTGDPMDDGTPTPPLHDGMGIIRSFGRWLVLCRNHEVSTGTPFMKNFYSSGAGGGTSNIVFDLKQERFVSAFPTLSGTIRNCAGGITPWGTWLTCEETIILTPGAGGRRHGYVFDVGPMGGSPNPLKQMGRFAHEAVAVDPRTDIVYQTEDGPSWPGDTASGVYRFVPKHPGSPNGDLQMMQVVGQPDMQDFEDRRRTLRVNWVPVPKADPATDPLTNALLDPSPFQQGLANGGSKFRRPEGCWYGDGKIFFLCTEGGLLREGQVFEYDIRRRTLKLLYVSTDAAILENPDNMVVTPNGELLLCEDNSGPTTNPGERLLFLSDGDISEFARNNMDFRAGGIGNYTRTLSGITYTQDLRQQEWAGASFSPDGDWLFVNIQTPGVTFAITGPWKWGRSGRRDWDHDDAGWDWDRRRDN